MIPELRRAFNGNFSKRAYSEFLADLDRRCGGPIQFRVAETPIFVRKTLLDELAGEGAALAKFLISDRNHREAAQQAIPSGFEVANETAHPNFLTADFALIRTGSGELAPRLVEIQAFPSVFAYQVELSQAYLAAFDLPRTLGFFLGDLDESSYWDLFRRTVVGKHDPKNVVLAEVDPLHQKTYADFYVTSQRLGIPTVDIAQIEATGKKLNYRDETGRLIPIDRIYNRAIADELIARNVRLLFGLGRPWDVEWAGHPNWYFLISKFSIPWLSRSKQFSVVPPAVFVDDFLAGSGRQFLVESGVPLAGEGEGVYHDLLLKPLFSFAGKGIEFEPSRARLEQIPPAERSSYLLQQRMRFEPTIETPFGLTQAEIRILYLWPDDGVLTPALSLVRLGRGKMMGVDHNKDLDWVGGSAAFYN
ncbi:MAG TPA: hypothetical protein VGI45_07805 [Terracidiphilus sp.]